MSLTQMDRKLRSKSGRSFPAPAAEGDESARFAAAIAEALKRQFGGTPGAVKTVVRLTGVNERAVKNWFDAKNGPNGENLVVLMRHSEEVLETVLALAGRDELVIARKLSGAREKLREMLAMIDGLEGR